jgi:hypothetical protein
MAMHGDLPDLSMEALCDVELEVYAEYNLDRKHNHENIGEGGVYVLREGSPFMQMSQEVCQHCNRSPYHLYWYVKSIPRNLSIAKLALPIPSALEEPTPRTIPKGKMMPKDSIINSI